MSNTERFISTEEAATQLKVSTAYVKELVRKGRLRWAGDNLLDAQEVEKLAQLMNKLRAGGIAALVEISGKDSQNN